MDQEIIKDLKFFRKKYHLSRFSWDLTIDLIIRLGDPDKDGLEDTIKGKLTPAESERMTRLCSFMADMIAKYGKEEVIRQIEDAA